MKVAGTSAEIRESIEVQIIDLSKLKACFHQHGEHTCEITARTADWALRKHCGNALLEVLNRWNA